MNDNPIDATEQPIPAGRPIPDGLREWAYASFKAIGYDLAAMAEEKPQFMPQYDQMVRDWDAITLRGADFGTAAIIVMERIERIMDSRANRK